MIFGLVLIFTVIAGFEVPGMVQKKYWRELFVYSGLLLLGFGLSVLLVIGVDFPPVTTILSEFISKLFGFKS